MKQWKFLDNGLTSHHDKSKWEIGVWREVDSPQEECVGLNASEYIQDALSYVNGDILAEVECDGEVIHSSDKSTWQRMRIVRAWKWGKNESVSLAVFSAKQCLNNFEDKYPDDDRPRKAIEIAENKSASRSAWSAESASWSAARSAAESAAWSAESAARSAAWSAESASRSASSAAESAAWSAESAAESAAWSAESAAWSAWSAESAAESAARSAAESAAWSAAKKSIHDYVVSELLPQMDIVKNDKEVES